MSTIDRLREKFDALNEAAEKLEESLFVIAPSKKPLVRGRLRAISNDLGRVQARISNLDEGQAAPPVTAAQEAELLAAIDDVGRAVGTSDGVNGLLAAATRLIQAFKVMSPN